MREVEDAHRIAHVEHEHVAAAADAAGLHDQLRGLVDRHEVARHLGVGDRHRPAARDLLAEDRHDRARRSEHVAEAHGDERRLVLDLAERLDDPLGERLAGAHRGLRVDGLVGRDEHEAVDARGVPRDAPRCAWPARCCAAPARDAAPSAARACRRRRGTRPPAAGSRRSSPCAPRRARRRSRARSRSCVLSRSSRSIWKRLFSAWSAITSRPTSMRTSWRQSSEPIEPPAPGDEHRAAAHVGAHGGRIELHGLAAEDVLHLHRAQLRDEVVVAVDEVVDVRQRLDRNARLAARCHHRGALAAAGRGQRDVHLVGLRAP